MENKKIDEVDLLLTELDRQQLEEFIRKECSNDFLSRERFLSLGARRLFIPSPAMYASRVEDLIEDYSGRNGYIAYRDTFDFNRVVSGIIDEADEAMANGQWEVAVAVLSGIASVCEEILNSGDDSAGELGALVSRCFETWHELCANESVPKRIKSDIFEYALSRFNDNDLKGWDWWWDWMQMGISLADTSEKQSRVFKALNAIKADKNDWSAKYTFETAQNYKIEMMSRCGSVEDQVKYMYDNVSNPGFRKRLIQMAWDKADYDEVIRLAKDGVSHDAKYAGLVNDWYQWEYKVYHEIGDHSHELQLARYFFFNGRMWGEKEFSLESMYSVLKSLIPHNEWPEYVETLVSEAHRKNDSGRLIHIFTQEKMWPEYMDYLRQDPSTYDIDEAPKEMKRVFRDENCRTICLCCQKHFQRACSRNVYREGVELLSKLIKYGGAAEAKQIVELQKVCTPRRPALINELSKL